MHYIACINPLTPNDPYSGRTAPLTSKRCILYIYSTTIGTEYFKHAIHSPFLSLQNAVCFIILTYLVPVLFTFYTQKVLKLKKKNSVPKGQYTQQFSLRRLSASIDAIFRKFSPTVVPSQVILMVISLRDFGSTKSTHHPSVI